eukprot:4964765-Ditylum_brightwellii.AAC.1
MSSLSMNASIPHEDDDDEEEVVEDTSFEDEEEEMSGSDENNGENTNGGAYFTPIDTSRRLPQPSVPCASLCPTMDLLALGVGKKGVVVKVGDDEVEVGVAS